MVWNINALLLEGLLLGAVYLAWQLYSSPLRSIPGPFLAKFSNVWRFIDVAKGKAQYTQRRLHKQHGSVVRVGPNCVSISDPSMIKQIYSRSPLLLKSDFYSASDFVVDRRRFNHIFSARDEEWHSNVAKPFSRLLSMSTLLKMEPLIDSTIMQFVRVLKQNFASGSNEGKICELHDWMAFFSWDAMSAITFGERMGFLEQGKDVGSTISTNDEAFDYFATIGQIPMLDTFLDKNPIYRMGPPVFGPAIETVTAHLHARRSGVAEKPIPGTSDILDLFIDLQRQDPSTVTDQVLLSYCFTNLIAGSDPIAIDGRAALYHLCKNKSAMSKLQKELDDNDVTVPVSWKTCQSLPYLNAVIQETLRVHPLTGLLLERVVGQEGLQLPDGRFLPQGTVVGMNPWVVHLDAKTFGEDPEAFRPDRWLRGDAESEEDFQKRFQSMSDGLFSFGYGKRSCAGKMLGLLEITKVIATLIRCLTFELAKPEEEWKTRNSFFVRQLGGMDVKIKVRQPHLV